MLGLKLFVRGLAALRVLLATAQAQGSALDEQSERCDAAGDGARCNAGSASLCTLEQVIDALDIDGVRELLASRSQNGLPWPVLLRGGARHWKASELASDHWRGLASHILDNHRSYGVVKRPASLTAQFGASVQTGHMTEYTTLEEHFHRIEESKASIAFETASGLGKQLLEEGLFDFKIGGSTYAKEMAKQPTISMGGYGVGVPFHHHGEALQGLVSGKKSWLLLPPSQMTEELHRQSYNVTRQFQELLQLPRSAWPAGLQYCEQAAGDMLYVPARWWHATYNEGISIGMGGVLHDTIDERTGDAPNNFVSRTANAVGKVRQPQTQQELDKGISELRTLYKEMPSKLSTTYYLVMTLYRTKQRKAARKHLTLVFEYLHTLELTHSELSLLFARIGMLALGGGSDPTTALKFFEEAGHLDPESSAAWAMTGFAINNMNQKDWKAHCQVRGDCDGTTKSNIEETVRRLRMALSIRPDYPEVEEALEKILGAGKH